MRKCEACGTTKNINGTLGGVLLCKEHFADISAEVTRLHAEGKQVNVAGMARQMFREQYSTGNYILRDIPKELWDAAKHRAVDDGVSLRELVLVAIQKHLDSGKAIENMTTELAPYDVALARVRSDDDLYAHKDVIIDYDWDNEAEHYEWVATADKAEILSWVASFKDDIATQKERDELLDNFSKTK